MTEAAMNELFVGLLMQLHYTAWVQLGKVANPGTGKVERNLEAAKETIDVLGALEEKSKGNLHAEEEKLLTRMLLDLRMNYVEETKQSGTPSKSEAPTESEESPASSAAGAPPPSQAQSPAAEPPASQAQSRTAEPPQSAGPPPTATAPTADTPASSEEPDKT